METPYTKAWDEFVESARYARLMELHRTNPSPADMYIENRIRSAFDAGWCAARNLEQQPTGDRGE